RNAIFVKLKADRIDGRLLSALFGFLIELVEIADRDRPPREIGQSLRPGVGRRFFAGRYRVANHSERVVKLVAGFRTVINRKFQTRFAFTRTNNNPAHFFGWKHCPWGNSKTFLLRLDQVYRNRLPAALSLTVDNVS